LMSFTSVETLISIEYLSSCAPVRMRVEGSRPQTFQVCLVLTCLVSVIVLDRRWKHVPLVIAVATFLINGRGTHRVVLLTDLRCQLFDLFLLLEFIVNGAAASRIILVDVLHHLLLCSELAILSCFISQWGVDPLVLDGLFGV